MSKILEVKVPAAGESVTEATLAEWLKADGEVVEQNDEILVLETDKASLEIVAEQGGKLSIKAEEGDTVQVGQVIAEIDTSVAASASTSASNGASTKASAEAAPDQGSTSKPAATKAVSSKAESLGADAFDLIVIGTGPGGYIGAIRAAQLGLKTAVIEKDPTFGGTCLNVGCIPSKALLESSEHFAQASHGLEDHGVEVGKPKLNLKKMLQRKDDIVGDLTGGVKYLFEKNKIETFKGLGKITGQHEVSVTDDKGKSQTLKTKNIMIATGSVPNSLPGLEVDGERIITSTEALTLSEVPKKMVVIGAGAIGLEMGSVWSRLGSEVTVIEYADKICGPSDKSISKRMMQILKKQGLNFVLQAKVSEAKVSGKSVEVTFESLKDGSKEKIKADIVLVAAGRKPFSEGVGLNEMGIETDQRGFIQVDSHWRTKYENIFAVGDVTPGPMLAHKAEEEGVAVAEMIATGSGHVNYETVPSVIYTDPELASVGKTEEELKSAGIAYKSGTFPFSVNGRAKAKGSTEGLVKVLADKETDRILGVHIVGPNASDLIGEAVVTMEFGGSAEDLARSFHAHPTLSEVVREAALNVNKMARQM